MRRNSGVIASSVVSPAGLAWSGVRDDVHANGVDRREMVCWTIHQLMTAAGEGIKHKQRLSPLARVVSWMRCWGEASVQRGRYGRGR